eukprot:COSAG01_NODE_49972_length_367_cov_1.708955_1_plen_53_part_10
MIYTAAKTVSPVLDVSLALVVPNRPQTNTRAHRHAPPRQTHTDNRRAAAAHTS